MITDEQYIAAARQLGCAVTTIKAVAAVESSGSGFFSTGEVKILFEPHVFWRELVAGNRKPARILQDSPQYADVLYPKWGTRPYGKRTADVQWGKLRKAGEIDLAAAYRSASFGKFQIMGFNHVAAGYQNIFGFAHYMNQGEPEHLQAFVNFLIHQDLHTYLARKQWDKFAYRYNGPGYKGSPATIKDDYDYKLEMMDRKLMQAA